MKKGFWKKLALVGIVALMQTSVAFASETSGETQAAVQSESETAAVTESETSLASVQTVEPETYVDGTETTETEPETDAVDETADSVKPENGFYTDEEGHTFYYENGEYLKDAEKFLDGGWRYFDANGIMRTGWIKHHNNQYYYDAEGKMVHGLYVIDGKTYGFDDVTGVQIFGEKNLSGAWRYFDPQTGEMATGWTQQADRKGKVYYYGEDGAMYYGIKTIDGVTYGFDEVTGVQIFGEKYTCGAWRYFDEKTGEMATGWTKHHNKEYYYGADGAMYYGIEKIDGVTYGFDEVTGVKIYGEKYIEKAWRYFDTKTGKMATGWSTHNGHKYYYNSDGSMYYGAKQIDGKWYYFTEKIGVMATGYAYHDGKYYYYNSDGSRYYGEKVVGGKWRYFDKAKGGAMVTGWSEHNGNKYYYNSKGEMVYGKQTISGKAYYFDKVTGVLKTGWRYENGYKVYYNSSGQLVQNVDSIIGKQSSYYVKVNTYTNTVTVFAKDGANGYIIPVKKMICSTGRAGTPTVKGTYTIKRYARWGTLMGPVYGQYCSQIYGGYLFHSAWYYVNGNNRTLSVSEYRKLGTNASHGCVRLTVADAKWIYDNCNGSKVYIYSSRTDGDPFTKPSRPNPVVVSGDYGYDPTDPAFN